MSEANPVMQLARDTLVLPDLTGEMRLRAAAILARQALEGAIASALASEGVAPERMSFRAQMETLRHLRNLDRGVTDAFFAWAALSRATHYHGYELPPTKAALTGWMRLACQAIESLEV